MGEPLESPSWSLSAVEFTTERNFYRSGPWALRESPSGGGFSHRCWVGVSPGPLGRSNVLLAAPYSRLLESLLVYTSALSPDGGATFIRPDLKVAFERFEIDPELARYRVSQITIQVLGQEAVELVTLTGKYPLRSKIRDALFGDAASGHALARPYALAVQDSRDRRSPRVHMDRHGNLWWFLANDSAILAVADVLDLFLHDSMRLQVTVSPLRRRGIAGYEGE
ncbi:MAG TPA: hypothetical protein VGC04_10625 [Cellulomonas sp.]